jgi:flagellar basal body-associated protein FliL
MKKILFIGIPVGLIVAGAIAVLLVLPAISGTTSGTPSESEAPPVAEPKPGYPGPMIAIESRVYNLPVGGAFRYAKLQLTLELIPKDESWWEEQAAAAEAEGGGGHGGGAGGHSDYGTEHPHLMPIIYDVVGQIIAKTDPSDIGTIEGRMALKAALKEAITEAIHHPEVYEVYLVDLVMQ